ncbi:MAG TPA: hypothetical protein VGI00_23975 [Streptosporangiaceae bacterium]|jgi:hypothetical protein
MNATPDYTAAGDGGSFDPAQAAALLNQTTQETRRKISPVQPWLLAIRAIAVLVVLGACWLNVRGQHPYRGPTSSVLPFVFGFVILNFAATVGFRRHAITGVTGESRFRPAEIVVLTLAWLAVLPLIWALHHAGVSNAAAYSLIPLTVPLIFAGLTFAAVEAARGDWGPFGVGLGVAATGAVALFAGPVGSWAVDAVGLCLVLLGSAVAVVWGTRRSVVRP